MAPAEAKATLDIELASAVYNIHTNDGPTAGQTVTDTRLHLIPRVQGVGGELLLHNRNSPRNQVLSALIGPLRYGNHARFSNLASAFDHDHPEAASARWRTIDHRGISAGQAATSDR
jgi:diadenosine tetraphosphate (Ap4A) HIT family hydrolase